MRDFYHLVETLLWIGTIANDIAKTEDLGDILLLNIGQHCLECFPITVNITNQGSSQLKCLSRCLWGKKHDQKYIVAKLAGFVCLSTT